MPRPLAPLLIAALACSASANGQSYPGEGLPADIRTGQPARVDVGGQAPVTAEIGDAPAVGTNPPQQQAPGAEPLADQGYSGTYVTRSQDGRRTEAVTTVTRRADGRYDVIRRVRSGEQTYQLQGSGQVRRGLLLVEWGEAGGLTGPPPEISETPEGTLPVEPIPGETPSESGGIVGALEGGSTPAEETEAAPGGISLSGSVGLGGANEPADVEIVQALLSKESFLDPGYGVGVADAALNEAIRRFQIKYVGYREPALTSRVDPGSETLQALNGKRLGERAFVVYSSVGEQGTNQSPDVKVVQEALILGGYLQASDITYGQNSRALEMAIRRYQVARAGFRVGDGRVDINHRTLAALNGETFAKVENALPAPGDMPLGMPLEDDPGAGPLPGDGALPPPINQLPPGLSSELPEVPEGVAVAAYKIEDHAIQGMVHDPSASGQGNWVFEHGVALREAAGVK